MNLRSSCTAALLGVTLLVTAPAVIARTQASQKSPDPQQNSVPSKDSGYLGAEVCKTCHEEIYNSWEKTPHWKTTLDTKGGPSHQGCEGCHGPGAAHVAGGGDKTKIFIFAEHSPKEINDRCLTCHASSIEHMNAANSLHRQNDVSCISCHSPHHAQTKEFLLVKAQPELCYTCHLQQKPQFAMPFHHRVNEGLVQCSDCHNPHGTDWPQAGARVRQPGRGLLQMPRRQARPVRFRARAGEDGRLLVVPRDPRFAQSAHAQIQQREHALPAVPHDVHVQQRSGNAIVSQPSHPISSLHALPRANPRVELRRDIFQIEMTMTRTMTGCPGCAISELALSPPRCLRLAALFLRAPLSPGSPG